MRTGRIPGSPSTLSGSSLSGGGLMTGSHRSRAPPPGVFVPGSSNEGTSKNTRTKAIIILGIALPVLACIIGIAAWAVTTDVLRISPRAHDNAFNRFGHQGKTRIDGLQPRNDIDIFQLHGISQAFSTTTPLSEKHDTTFKSFQTPTTTPTVRGAVKSGKSPKASDIISKLISDMPTSKQPTNFVVFAPVADTSNKNIPSDGRRFDGKVIVHDGEDLVAEESVYSIENSQESIERPSLFSRRRKSSRDGSFAYKSEEVPSQIDKNMKIKKNTNPHYFPRGKRIEDSSRFPKRMHDKSEETMLRQRVNETPQNLISNRNADSFPVRTNTNEHLNLNNFNTRGNNKREFQQLENAKTVAQQRLPDMPPQYPIKDGNGIQSYPQSSHHAQNARPFLNQGKDISYHPPANGVMQSKSTFPKAPHNQQNLYTQQPPQNSQNQPPQYIQGLKYSGPNQLPQQSLQNQQMPPQQSLQNQQMPPQQSLKNQPMSPQQNQQYMGPNSQSQHLHSKQPIPSHQGQSPGPIQHQEPFKIQNPQGYQPAPPSSFHGNPSPPSYNPPPQSPPPSNYGNNNHPQYQHSVPDNTHAANGGPQYFAPPPQTFHTKTSYDNPSKLLGSSSMASYEKVAQSTVEQSKDGHHHHHHHHHHHEPSTSNSDPIGDVNFSDVPKTNDADRLGTIGLGIGPPRGITVQIGGGGGGGGLGGLLPLGALGVAKNIVSSLLPRPAFGLNSKVFLGVEVGRGGGLSLIG